MYSGSREISNLRNNMASEEVAHQSFYELTEGPFFNSQKAAEYCGYAPGTFERLVREYAIPKYGPKRNRFAKSVLDAWMHTPETFKKNPLLKPRQHTPKPVIV